MFIKWLLSNKPEALDVNANYSTLKAAQAWTEEQQALNYCGVVSRKVTTHAAFWERVDGKEGEMTTRYHLHKAICGVPFMTAPPESAGEVDG